jgi:hypothetical protein
MNKSEYDLTDFESELAAIKLARAIDDPFIVHPAGEQEHLDRNHRIFTDIQEARLVQIRKVPIQDRIEFATIPEALLYIYTASFTEQNVNQEFNKIYNNLFSEYSRNWSSELSISHGYSTNELTDRQREIMTSIKRKIKSDRDKDFILQNYDELSIKNVPKSFWLPNHSFVTQRSE